MKLTFKSVRSYFSQHPLLSLCICIFLFSFSIRSLHGLEYVTFGQDQARDAYIMSQYKEERRVIINYGPKASVANFYLPPFYYQLHNIVSWFSGENPLVMQWVIILVESFTPVILFLWLRMIVYEKSALLGSLLYVVSAGVI